MKVTPIKTQIVHAGDELIKVLDAALPKSLPERSVLVVTSKIVALCENAVAQIIGGRTEKHDLVRKEAEYYIDPTNSKYDLMVTVRDGLVAVNAGIDESNADGQYVLFPDNPYGTAAHIWNYLRKKFSIKEVGVLITDSKTIPLKWGTVGTALAHCGFEALNDKRGELDLFGHEMMMTQVNTAEALAAAAVITMGEVSESQPLAIIEDIPMIKFMDHELTTKEIEDLQIDLDDDVFSPILKAADWKKGGRKRNG